MRPKDFRQKSHRAGSEGGAHRRWSSMNTPMSPLTRLMQTLRATQTCRRKCDLHIATRQRWMVSRGRRDMRGAVSAILGNGDSSDADADAAKPRGEGPCANALQRPGASLWQDAGAPAGWADGQVGTSHFVQAPSMRPIHATATSRAIHAPASMTKRGMIPLALSVPAPALCTAQDRGREAPRNVRITH